MRSQSAAQCLAAAEITRGFIKFLLAHRSPNSGRRRHSISPFTLPPSFALSSTIPQRLETPLLIHLLPARVTGNSSFLDSFYSFVMLSFTVANPPPILSYRSSISSTTLSTDALQPARPLSSSSWAPSPLPSLPRWAIACQRCRHTGLQRHRRCRDVPPQPHSVNHAAATSTAGPPCASSPCLLSPPGRAACAS